MQSQQAEYSFRGHILALDGLRGLAIAMVMVAHFIFRSLFSAESTYRVVQGGWLGVDLFFVLSGFLITGILSDAKTRHADDYWPRFYSRRLLRIFPLYYFSVLVVWLTVIFVEHAPERLSGYDSFGWFFGFAPNIAIALKGDWLYHSHIFSLNHLWSVAVEEQFYLVWPFVVLMLPQRWLLVLCALLVHFSVDLRHWADTEFDGHGGWTLASYMLPFCRMDGLASGAFIAVLLRLGWQRYIPYDRWIVRILLVWTGWRMVDAVANGSTQYLGTLSALTFACMLYLALNPHPHALIRRVCEWRLLVHLGKYSYGLYIFHEMFKISWESAFGHRLLNSGWPPAAIQLTYILLASAGSYALARLSWALIEGPFLKMKEAQKTKAAG
ncbi:MAG TPA: acyltransferase [Saprospiraceae bacterium]|nr:acyltransferase [Saprospiraceae bacterium]HND86980.1 acyltransferase [Saprospiraceae bacterium]